MSELTLCCHPSPFPAALPCAREKGHDGEHAYWTQGTRKRGSNGVWTGGIKLPPEDAA